MPDVSQTSFSRLISLTIQSAENGGSPKIPTVRIMIETPLLLSCSSYSGYCPENNRSFLYRFICLTAFPIGTPWLRRYSIRKFNKSLYTIGPPL